MNTSRRALTWTEANGQRLKQVQHGILKLRTKVTELLDQEGH